MDVISLLFLLLLAAFGWFWLDSLRALEIARKAGKRACDEAHLQFLDDTVAGIALALVRDTVRTQGVAPHLPVRIQRDRQHAA